MKNKHRGSDKKQTSSVKISASNAQSLLRNINLHTTNIFTSVRFLKLV